MLDGVDGKGLRGVAEDYRPGRLGRRGAVGVSDGKAAVTVAATSTTAGKINAADLARAAMLAMDGRAAAAAELRAGRRTGRLEAETV